MADNAGSVSARVLELAKDSVLDEALACKKTSQLLDLAKGLGCLQDDVARAVDDDDAKGELTKIVQTKATSIVERAAAQEGRQKEWKEELLLLKWGGGIEKNCLGSWYFSP